MTMKWQGVFPAITTPFRGDLSVDHESLADHVDWLVESGCHGIVALGSLGEGATLEADEKVAILETCHGAIAGRVPLVSGISGLSTSECVRLARRSKDAGCEALMVLPPYVYRGDWRETEAHFSAVITATDLPCLIYNNPIAYGTDLTSREIEVLARHENVEAVKESSGDVRRVTAILEAMGDRLAVLAGLDDMIVEAVAMGGSGWVAGLVNALPAESLRLFELAADGATDRARTLYNWFLPLLRMDTRPKFVQLIKLVQQEVGRGSTRVRPPRRELEGEELEAARHLIQERLASRPDV